MGLLSLIIGLAGGVCGIMGILTVFEVLPSFIAAPDTIGPVWGTTLFFWGLAALLFLASIAINSGNQGSTFD